VNALTRLATPSAERSRSPLWLWPLVSSVVALVVALPLARLRPRPGTASTEVWPGGVDAASTMLQVMAASVMTATTLTFTVTVVTLQLASQQFSPRLLREFTRDPVTKRVLSVLAATFVFTTTVLRALHADEPVPVYAVLAGHLLGLASLAGILFFVTHIARTVRVDTMMLNVHDETDRAIATFYPEYGDTDVRDGDELRAPPRRRVHGDGLEEGLRADDRRRASGRRRSGGGRLRAGGRPERRPRRARHTDGDGLVTVGPGARRAGRRRAPRRHPLPRADARPGRGLRVPVSSRTSRSRRCRRRSTTP
jgi:hypothetical protein